MDEEEPVQIKVEPDILSDPEDASPVDDGSSEDADFSLIRPEIRIQEEEEEDDTQMTEPGDSEPYTTTEAETSETYMTPGAEDRETYMASGAEARETYMTPEPEDRETYMVGDNELHNGEDYSDNVPVLVGNYLPTTDQRSLSEHLHYRAMQHFGSYSPEDIPESPMNSQVKNYRGRGLYYCPMCCRPFAWQSGLIHHMQTHSAAKDYICTICSKAFGGKIGLKKHMLVHVDDRPFQCTTCEKSFKDRLHLNRHARVHTTERPYVCVTCGKTFRGRSALLRHSQIHTGVKPAQCPQCNKRFRDASVLRLHMKCHIKPTPENTDKAMEKNNAPSTNTPKNRKQVPVLEDKPENSKEICSNDVSEFPDVVIKIENDVCVDAPDDSEVTT